MWFWPFFVLPLSCLAIDPKPHGSHAQHKEHGVDPVDITIAVMLFGSITFHMSLFYLVNQRDKDMRRYSWETIGSIISIFCSLLVFQGVEGIVSFYLPIFANKWWKVVADFCHFAVWLLLLQAIIYYKAGANTHERRLGHLQHQEAKASSIVLAHITGFASIYAWGSIQQLPYFASSPGRAFLVVPMAYCGLLVIAKITDTWREWKVLQDDGVKDHNEELWDDEVEEAEDDIIGLTVSFLTTQAVRFAICSTLPNQEGHLHHHLTQEQCAMLLGCAFAVLPVVLIAGCLNARMPHKQKGTFKGRLVSSMHMVSSMILAWCLLFALDSIAVHIPIFQVGEGVMRQVIIALLVSAIAFVLIFILDKLADLDITGEDADRAIIAVILSFGTMVGFSWEHCFHAAIEAITEGAFHPGAQQEWAQLGMALTLVTIVLPAWKMYIVGERLLREEEEEEEEEMKSKEAKKAD